MHGITDDPEEVLKDVWGRVERIVPPVSDPPGSAWHFALGALFAFGSVGALDNAQIRKWDALAQSESKRLGTSSQ